MPPPALNSSKQASGYDGEGVALTLAQVAQLTSDIVWLVEKVVTLPDGSSQKVLVPQVYLLPRSGDLNSDGTLIAGQRVSIRAAGELINHGTLAGRTLLDLSAANVQNLGGRLTGHSVQVAARMDNRGQTTFISSIHQKPSSPDHPVSSQENVVCPLLL